MRIHATIYLYQFLLNWYMVKKIAKFTVQNSSAYYSTRIV